MVPRVFIVNTLLLLFEEYFIWPSFSFDRAFQLRLRLLLLLLLFFRPLSIRRLSILQIVVEFRLPSSCL